MKIPAKIINKKRVYIIAAAFLLAIIMEMPLHVWAQTPPEPVVAIHVSEWTQALETIPATPPTPTGVGFSGYEWWYTTWHYFVAYESLKEALRSDGTPFVEVNDAAIAAGSLLYPDGSPRYPILFSLASEATTIDVVTGLRNFVSAGGFLFVGSSALTRNTNGTTRGDFALANEMGLHMVVPALLDNWYSNTTFTKVVDHRLVSVPTGTLNWRMPLRSEEITYGVSPDHPIHGNHWVFQVDADSGTTVIANSASGPLLATRQYGNGNFIYHGASQPLIGHGGWDPGMYAYLIYHNAIEWAFESANLPIIKLSPWRYDYDAAFIVRHDFEGSPTLIRSILDSAIFEHDRGVKGDYYFCTGTLREEMPDKDTVIPTLESAVTSYGATIGPHNGGLKNPVNTALNLGDADYWHWGPDEALDVTSFGTSTYTSGKQYASDSISISFQDIEGWLATVDNGRPGCRSAGNCPRLWNAPYFNATREDSYIIVDDLGAVTAGEQKIGPFPHWTLSTKTNGKRYPQLSLPVSDWYVGNDMTAKGGALDGGHTEQTMNAAVDFYYSLGALTNFYTHEVSDGTTLTGKYVQYAVDKGNRMWAANAVGMYDWWKVRSNIVTTSSYSISGNIAAAQVLISGATDTGTTIEVAIPPLSGDISNLQQVLINGSPSADYRTLGNKIKVHVGASASSVTVKYAINGYNPLPTTTSLSPSVSKAGGSAFTLTVNGTGFVAGSVVQWNGVGRTTTYISSTQLTAAIPASDTVTAGIALVTVSNTAPGGGISNAQIFSIDGTSPTAAITYSPTGPYKSGAVVTITANFSEPMADFPVPQISISGVNTLAATNMTKETATRYTYSFTVSAGTGTANAALSTGTDLAGNVVVGTPTSGGSFIVDNPAPTLVISAPSSTIGNSSGTVSYTVAYSGADTITLTPGNITLNTTGYANGTIGVIGSGNTRTITIFNITGNGTIGISIGAGTASDMAGNTAAAAGPSTTFTVVNNTGDLNGDGKVDMIDALKALRIAAGLDALTPVDLDYGDVAPLVNGTRHPDGKIDLSDVVAILRKTVSLPSW